jgi:hypothetical protein
MKKEKSRNLFLVLKKNWYKAVARGIKRIEYREFSEYWKARIGDEKKSEEYKTVEFQCGYSRKYPRLKFKVKEICVIKTPLWLKGIIKTGMCYEIEFE